MVYKLNERWKHIVSISSRTKLSISSWIWKLWLYGEFRMIIYYTVLRIRIYVIMGLLYINLDFTIRSLRILCSSQFQQPKRWKGDWVRNEYCPRIVWNLKKHAVQCGKVTNIHLVKNSMTVQPNTVTLKCCLTTWFSYYVVRFLLSPSKV